MGLSVCHAWVKYCRKCLKSFENSRFFMYVTRNFINCHIQLPPPLDMAQSDSQIFLPVKSPPTDSLFTCFWHGINRVNVSATTSKFSKFTSSFLLVGLFVCSYHIFHVHTRNDRVEKWKRAFPPLPTRPQLMALYPALFSYTFLNSIFTSFTDRREKSGWCVVFNSRTTYVS